MPLVTLFNPLLYLHAPNSAPFKGGILAWPFKKVEATTLHITKGITERESSGKFMEGSNLTITIAFLAGLASFLSPCVLPLVPGYVSLISGVSIDRLKGEEGSHASAAPSSPIRSTSPQSQAW